MATDSPFTAAILVLRGCRRMSSARTADGGSAAAYAAAMPQAGLAHGLIVADAVTAIVLLAVGMSGFMLWRSTRRRVRAIRRRARALLGPRAGGSSLGLMTVATSPVTQPAWWGLQRERQRLWRSVTAAEYAVTSAARGNAPIGDLPSLTRRLRATAGEVDAALCAASRAPGGPPAALKEECRDLQRAAADIHRCAAQSATGVLGGSQDLLSAIRIEVQALATGVHAARRAATIGHR